MQQKLTDWFLGLPAIVIMLVLMLLAVVWFGTRYLAKREKFWQVQLAAKDEMLKEQTAARDAMLKDIIDKLFTLYNDAINRENTVIQELKLMQGRIDEWFRR